jgi:hypothetical protein
MPFGRNLTPEQRQALEAEQAAIDAANAQAEIDNRYNAYINVEDDGATWASRLTDPNRYYGAAAAGIGDMMFSAYTKNKGGQLGLLSEELESLKDKSPQAYYDTKLKFLGQQMGWQIGQNRSERNATTEKEIRDLIPAAMASGLSADQINATVGNNLNAANSMNQQRIAREASQGNFWTENLIGTAKVGALAAGAYGLDAALAAGAQASSALGSGAIDSTAAALGGSAGGGAFVPAAGSGASFTLPGLASTAPLTTAELLSSSGFTPNAGSSFAIDPTAAYTTAANVATGAPVYDYSQPFSFEQMGPTYQELGVTGVEGGMAGPTYGELGYSGLNQSEAIAAAEAASKGLTGADALKYANQARQGINAANTLAKLLGGSAGAANAVKSANSSSGLNSLANLLRPTAQTSSYLGQIKANQDPFTFTSPGQTVASPGMYDVSGSNMANALRKA